MADSARYTRIAIILHWVMAIAFIGMLASGLIMTNEWVDKSLTFKLYQWHKSLGVLLLLTFFVRVAWRLTHKPPALPQGLKKLDIKLSKLGHLGLYVMMIAMPITGWIMVSASPYGLPTIVFGWFEWPHVPGIENDKALNDLMHEFHEYLALGFMALIAAHIGATLKHMWLEKIPLLRRMWFR